VVRVSVQREIHTRPVDRLGQQERPEEREDLGRLSLQRRADRRVVRQRDLEVDALDLGERSLEALGQCPRVPDKRLHLRLAELRPRRSREPAAESLASGDADLGAPDGQDQVLAFENGDARALEHGAHLVLPVRVVVVIAQDRYGRHRQIPQLAGEHLRLRRIAVLREVTGDEQDVGVAIDPFQARPERARGVLSEMDVAGGGDPDHVAPSMRSTVGRLSSVVPITVV
jgi:hypothetical protein